MLRPNPRRVFPPAVCTTRTALLIVALLVLGLPAQAGVLTKVPNDRVCMINNEYMAKPQIPVTVGGKIYYGCCQNCVGSLKGDEKVRTAVDPVSERKVDKAAAVIGAFPGGKVLYFESIGTFQAYNKAGKPAK